MSASELFNRARIAAPKMQMRDLRIILRSFQRRELVRCLTPRERNGKIYFWTLLGRKVFKQCFDSELLSESRARWRQYAFLMKGRVRRNVLLAVVKTNHFAPDGKSAAAIQDALPDRGITLSYVSEALRKLESQGLVRHRPGTKPYAHRLYSATGWAKRIVRLLPDEKDFKEATRSFPDGRDFHLQGQDEPNDSPDTRTMEAYSKGTPGDYAPGHTDPGSRSSGQNPIE